MRAYLSAILENSIHVCSYGTSTVLPMDIGWSSVYPLIIRFKTLADTAAANQVPDKPFQSFLGRAGHEKRKK